MCKHNNELWIYELADAKYEYCFLSGKFRFRACSLNQKKRWGRIAGGFNSEGYVCLGLTIDGKRRKLKAHRLAIYLATGEMPKEVVNHIDGNTSNNRLNNLETCSHRYNVTVGKISLLNESKSSKYTGVSWKKDKNRWKAEIQILGKNVHLGYFKSEEKAAAAYQKALQELEVN